MRINTSVPRKMLDVLMLHGSDILFHLDVQPVNLPAKRSSRCADGRRIVLGHQRYLGAEF